MKHLRLFLVAFATVLGLGASAQTLVGDEAAEGDFFLYNVGAQKYLSAGDPDTGWGTNAFLTEQATLDFGIATASNGAYSLNSRHSNGGALQYLSSSLWVDGALAEWNFTATGDADNSYILETGGQYLVANAAGVDVEMAASSEGDNAKWLLLSKATLIEHLANATEDSPLDATFFIHGSTFNRNDQDCVHRQTTITNPGPFWTCERSGGNYTIAGPDGNRGNYGCELWNNTFDFYQTITELPAGKYELTVQGYGTAGTTYIYAGDTEAPFVNTNSSSNFANALDEIAKGSFTGNTTGIFNFAGGDLKIGLKRPKQSGADWTVFDNFRLTYYGAPSDPLQIYKELLQAAVEEAQAIEESTLTAAAYTALQNAITENNKEYTTAEDYTTATEAVKEATKTAKEVATAFSRYNTVKANVLAVSSDVNTADADAAADAATTADQVETAVSAVRMALLDNLATKELPEAGYFDLTNAIIDNPTVSQNIDFWTIENLSATGGSAGVTNYGETEFYDRTFDFFQTLTLTKGTYEFGVTGFHRAGNHSTYFYAGDNKVLIPGVESSVVNNMAQAKDYFDNGNGKVNLKFALESESNIIKVGIVNNDTETDKWTIFRNFTLRYYGNIIDLTPYQEAWAAAVAAAEQAIADHPNVTGEELTAVNTAKADTPEETVDSYTEKTNALVEATQTFNAAVAAYDAYAAEKAIAEKIGADTGEAPTNAAEAAAKVNELKVAEFNFVGEEYPYDYTAVIGDFGTWTGTATVEGAPATPAYLQKEHWSGQTHAYYEQARTGWGSNAWTVKYEKKAKLPAGDYMLKVAARSSVDVTSNVSCSATDFTVSLPNVGAATKGIDKSGNANFGEGDFANNGLGFGWEWRFLPFSLTEETEVTMTFYGETNKMYNWMSIADGTLLSKQEIVNVVELKGTDAEVIGATVASEVNTDRKLLSGLNTIILPFDVTQEEIKASTVLQYTGTVTEEGVTTLYFKEVAPIDGKVTLQPNVPYAVFVDADQTEPLSFGKKNIAPAEDLTTEDTNGLFDFVGTYVDLVKGNTTVAKGDMVASVREFKKATGGNRIAAYRAYMKKVGEAEPANIAFDFNGEVVTGIEAVEILNRMSGDIYNINGQKVSRTQRGVYIINGKKVIVK